MTYQSLKESGKVFNLQLSETMLRYYQVSNVLINAYYYIRHKQVLPARTHPVIQMNGTGGYLLTGTTIVKS